MGGLGSGRKWRERTKAVTNHYRSIDIRIWQREQLLMPRNRFSWVWNKKTAPITVYVRQKQLIITEQSSNHQYSIKLDITPCHYGGIRYWFRCPGAGCKRRAAILYQDGIFLCRHCLNLAYPSQNEQAYIRIQRKLHQIRETLEWDSISLNQALSKPKRMHWRTYHYLVKKYNKLIASSDTLLSKELQKVTQL